MITREILIHTINSFIDKEEYKIKTLEDIFVNGDHIFYTDEFYYNAAYILESLIRQTEE